ncbi:UDP-N-acetylglucosamine 2-epimerase [Intrasporangium sp. DVR]|uniref:UDP-N-acetylglucosamine 2-epimerase n=1 Tax=Intrasporangium sp. DVR TaxID=3127867 RepID=UPI00313A75B1
MGDARTVAVFVGTRADLGPLTPVISVLAEATDIDLHLLTGVMYAADELVRALPRAARSAAVVHALAEPMGEMTVEAQLEQGARLSAAAGEVLAQIRADSLVVLGDRWELLYVVPPAFLLGVPIVHLHGGEVTEGAVDERIRHAVTKLGDEHCVASPDAAQRLAQMGEPEARIHVTGAPGLDRLAEAAPLDDAALAGLLGVDRVERPVALFTYHPPTAQAGAPVGQWALAAAEATLAVCGTVIGTHPGMDEGRDEIITALTALAAREPRFRFLDAIGVRYPRVLAAVDVVVGNSSSGVIEAATLHLPAVDVGERQRGRLRGDNVTHATEGREAVERAVRLALSPESRTRARAVVNPYGSGDASHRILAIVRRAGGAGRVKPFVDTAASGRTDDNPGDRAQGEEVAP